MQKKLKKMIAVVVSLTSVIALAGCAGPLKKDVAPYEVKIDKSFICGSYEGDMLVIDLEVKNNSKEYLKAFSVSYEIEAKLDGKTLENGYLTDDNPNALNAEESIESGKTGKAQVVYQLGDKTEGEVSLLGVTYSMNSGKQVEFLKETVDLADAERIVSESNYELTIDSVVATDDGEGANIVIIDMTFTNNGEEAASFGSALQFEIFQNGVALKSGYLPYNHPAYNEEIRSNSYLDIQKGATLTVREIYTLNDAAAPVQLKVVDSRSYDKAVIIEKEIQLK